MLRATSAKEQQLARAESELAQGMFASDISMYSPSIIMPEGNMHVPVCSETYVPVDHPSTAALECSTRHLE